MFFFFFLNSSLSVIRSLSGDAKQLSLMLSLPIPQPSTSKLFIIQSIIFSLFWTPVHEMKRQAAKPVFLYLNSGKHNLPRLHSPQNTHQHFSQGTKHTRAYVYQKNTLVLTHGHIHFLILSVLYLHLYLYLWYNLYQK